MVELHICTASPRSLSAVTTSTGASLVRVSVGSLLALGLRDSRHQAVIAARLGPPSAASPLAPRPHRCRRLHHLRVPLHHHHAPGHLRVRRLGALGSSPPRLSGGGVPLGTFLSSSLAWCSCPLPRGLQPWKVVQAVPHVQPSLFTSRASSSAPRCSHGLHIRRHSVLDLHRTCLVQVSVDSFIGSSFSVDSDLKLSAQPVVGRRRGCSQ